MDENTRITVTLGRIWQDLRIAQYVLAAEIYNACPTGIPVPVWNILDRVRSEITDEDMDRIKRDMAACAARMKEESGCGEKK